jgi:hypothetical protein
MLKCICFDLTVRRKHVGVSVHARPGKDTPWTALVMDVEMRHVFPSMPSWRPWANPLGTRAIGNGAGAGVWSVNRSALQSKQGRVHIREFRRRLDRGSR